MLKKLTKLVYKKFYSPTSFYMLCAACRFCFWKAAYQEVRYVVKDHLIFSLKKVEKLN